MDIGLFASGVNKVVVSLTQAFKQMLYLFNMPLSVGALVALYSFGMFWLDFGLSYRYIH